MYNRGTKYLEKGKYDKALACFKKQAQTHSFKELHLNMGNTYRFLDKNELALKHYELAASPSTPFSDGKFCTTYPLAVNNIGLLAYAMGDDETAISHYKTALSIDPLHYDAIWNYGNALLRSTNCSSQTGWEAYEYRFKRSGARITLDLSLPIWTGIECGDAIVVQTEQGIGDKIMFGRYLYRLKEFFTTVYVVCHASLEAFYSDFICVRSVAETPATHTVGICSLAKFFGVIPENYLDGKFVAKEFDAKEFNIGVVWSGSATHVNNRHRSCESYHFTRLADLGCLYSLNPNATTARSVIPMGTSTWAETASMVLGLDCVVTVDTSIVHLCGTLGVPCIMIQPRQETDFRWGNGSRSTVWYKSVTIVENNGWEEAFVKVRSTLVRLRKDKFATELEKLVEAAKYEDSYHVDICGINRDIYGQSEIKPRNTNV